MNPNQIAILVDSCTDVPEEYLQQHGIYSVPITIIYQDREYKDKIDITAQEVYDRLEIEVPRTSLPDSESVRQAMHQIRKDGFTNLLVVTIAGALSGTNSMMHMVAQEPEQEGMDIRIIDTKSIGAGAGVQAILAAELVAAGDSFDEVERKVRQSLGNSSIYFCLSTLEYLARGGRIGKVSAVLGSLLKIKPIITCNEEGAYAIAAKVRGRAQAIAETINLAVNAAKKHVACTVAVVHGNAREEAAHVMNEVKRLIPNSKVFYEGTVSPALVVHTGPGLIGINVQALPA